MRFFSAPSGFFFSSLPFNLLRETPGKSSSVPAELLSNKNVLPFLYASLIQLAAKLGETHYSTGKTSEPPPVIYSSQKSGISCTM